MGRLDPKADRKEATLIIRAIYLEEDQDINDDDLVSSIRGALREFMAFHECNSLRIERSEPAGLARLLE